MFLYYLLIFFIIAIISFFIVHTMKICARPLIMKINLKNTWAVKLFQTSGEFLDFFLTFPPFLHLIRPVQTQAFDIDPTFTNNKSRANKASFFVTPRARAESFGTDPRLGRQWDIFPLGRARTKQVRKLGDMRTPMSRFVETISRLFHEQGYECISSAVNTRDRLVRDFLPRCHPQKTPLARGSPGGGGGASADKYGHCLFRLFANFLRHLRHSWARWAGNSTFLAGTKRATRVGAFLPDVGQRGRFLISLMRGKKGGLIVDAEKVELAWVQVWEATFSKGAKRNTKIVQSLG